MFDWEFVEELSKDWYKNKSVNELTKICYDYWSSKKKDKSLYMKYYIAKIVLLKKGLGEKGQPVKNAEKMLERYLEKYKERRRND